MLLKASATTRACTASVAGVAVGACLLLFFATQHYSPLFQPTVASLAGLEVVWQIPRGATLVLVLIHGCNHAATHWWPAGSTCPQCLGLPEEKRVLRAALLRGWAAVAFSAPSPEDFHCFRERHVPAATSALRAFLAAHAELEGAPIAGYAMSAGATLLRGLALSFRMRAAVAASQPPLWHVAPSPQDEEAYDERMPPTLIIYMRRDVRRTACIHRAALRLVSHGVPVALIGVEPRPITPDWFARRIDTLAPPVSARLQDALHAAGWLDARDLVQFSPRRNYTFRAALAPVVAASGLRDSLLLDHSAIFEEMNVAYGFHEGLADHIDASMRWISSAGHRPPDVAPPALEQSSVAGLKAFLRRLDARHHLPHSLCNHAETLSWRLE